MTPKQARAIADRLEPAIRRAFLQSVQNMTRAQLSALTRAIEAGNEAEVLRLLNVTRAAFFPLEEAQRNAMFVAGTAELVTLSLPPGRALNIGFDGRNPRAERYLTQVAGRRIVEIVEETRAIVRGALTQGQIAGKGARSVALDLVGRVTDGRRQGSLIGLNSQQAQWVNGRFDQATQRIIPGMRQELSDPALMRNYFTRQRRDARFDKIVRKALEDGKPVSAVDIDRITTRYSDRLLQLRGQTIAVTETNAATSAGRMEAMQQLVEREGLRPEQVRKVWATASDERVRASHMALHGDSVGLNEAFGNGLQYPGDLSGPPEEVINCRCSFSTRVVWDGFNG
jgi:hypothetical protein